MKTLNILLGCDPEIFFVDQSQVFRSVIGKIGGSKEHPLPLTDLGDGFAVQEDNVAAEFNIPPAKNAEEFVKSVQSTLNFLIEGVRGSYGFDLSRVSAAEFPAEELANPKAQEFGCDPDFNAWTGRRNPRPKADSPYLRTAGGHIHVGYTTDVSLGKERAEHAKKIIRSMDLFLGVPSVLMDKGERRKELYGCAGAFRLKPYGVEYRTLSNFWIMSPRLCQWAWDNTLRAVQAVDAQFPVEEDRELIVNAINSNEKDMARHLVNKYKLETVYA